MIKIGAFQKLKIAREMPQGFYLEDEEENEVLFPRNFITEEMAEGDEIEVFVYNDTTDIVVATTEIPLLTVGGFATLVVKEVTDIGAFCEWGVSKDLFVPFRNQISKLVANRKYVVHMYHDLVSDRLVGSTKLKPFLQHTADDEIVKGQEVDMLVFSESDLGYNVVINQKYGGLIYDSDVHEILRRGQSLKGYVKPIREDGKIDISLFPLGRKSTEPNSTKIMEKLKENDNFLPFTDKSSPEVIADEFGMSKKLFKRALGNLYKHKMVRLQKDGIYLVDTASKSDDEK